LRKPPLGWLFARLGADSARFLTQSQIGTGSRSVAALPREPPRVATLVEDRGAPPGRATAPGLALCQIGGGFRTIPDTKPD